MSDCMFVTFFKNCHLIIKQVLQKSFDDDIKDKIAILKPYSAVRQMSGISNCIDK